MYKDCNNNNNKRYTLCANVTVLLVTGIQANFYNNISLIRAILLFNFFFPFPFCSEE